MNDPIPPLDLSRMFALAGRAPFRVLDVLVEGLPPNEVKEAEATGGWTISDVDPEFPSTFIFRSADDAVRGPFRVRRAEEAWELAEQRGLLPAGFTKDSRRVFADPSVTFFCRSCGGQGATGYNLDDFCEACQGKGRKVEWGSRRRPAQRAVVQWMSWGPEVVTAAESLAREAVARLGLWGEPTPDLVCWGRKSPAIPDNVLSLVWESPVLARMLPLLGPRSDWREVWAGTPFQETPWWAQARLLTDDTRRMLCADVAGAMAFARAQREGKVPECPNPFEPVLRMWELGIVFEELIPQAIVLDHVSRRARPGTWRAGMPPAPIHG